MELTAHVILASLAVVGVVSLVTGFVMIASEAPVKPVLTHIDQSIWLECAKCRTRWICPSRLDAYQDGWQQQVDGTWLCDVCRED